MGGLFDKARQIAGNNPTFNKYIQGQYNNFLVSNENAEEMAAQGGAMGSAAIEMYVQRNDWEKVGPDALDTWSSCVEILSMSL